MGHTEKKYFKEIIIAIFSTVIGGFIIFLITQVFLIDYIYGYLSLIIFMLSILVLVLSYFLYQEKKINEKISVKKKPLMYGIKGKDKDDWLWER